MGTTNFSEKYYNAVKTASVCVEQLNMLLNDSDREILSTLLVAQNIILSEQVCNRFYEGWHHGREFSFFQKDIEKN